MMETASAPAQTQDKSTVKPRLGFLGLGWIGRHRMAALAQSGLAEITALADPVPANLEAAAEQAPDAVRVSTLEELLELDLDAVVIATPSALHAEQAITALQAGRSVFCQKPLARTRGETERVIDAARRADRLLAVDLSYRFLNGAQKLRSLIQTGELGHIFAVDLVFHNAYGPDKAWFYDFKLSGGGCVIDLGIHLVDLAFWVLGESSVAQTASRLYAQGQVLSRPPETVEDYASAMVDLASGTSLHLACSWKLQAGCDAVIAAAFHGTKGGAEVRNVNGSFYEFRTERFHGTSRELLQSGPEEWGGRATVDWLKRLAEGERYNPEIERLLPVAGTLDAIYGRK